MKWFGKGCGPKHGGITMHRRDLSLIPLSSLEGSSGVGMAWWGAGTLEHISLHEIMIPFHHGRGDYETPDFTRYCSWNHLAALSAPQIYRQLAFPDTSSEFASAWRSRWPCARQLSGCPASDCRMVLILKGLEAQFITGL
jgi:hypothetical protein